MTSERECYVYIVLPGQTEFVTAGRFRVSETRDGMPFGEFVYGRSYLRRSDAVELDPVELKLANRNYETARMSGFFGAIRDAMPDYWGRRVIEKRSGHTRLKEFDYLMQGADDRAGALGFGLNVEPPAPRRNFNRALDLERLQTGADAIIADDPARAGSAQGQAEDLLLEGTSMGGARPKAVVQDNHALWLAKFGRRDDRWNHPRVEHALLQLARECGISAADSRIETIGGRDVLLVRRFDRDWSGDGYHRHRMVSALTLLQSEDTQTARGRWSYLLLADEVRRASARPEDDLHEIFARMCFSAAISNLDAHPRNHALLAKDKTWRLSPAYDLTPMPVVALDRRDLAMECGPLGRLANKSNLIGAAGRFLLDREDTEAIFNRISETVRASWYDTMRRAGVSEQDYEAIRSAFLYEGLFFRGDLIRPREKCPAPPSPSGASVSLSHRGEHMRDHRDYQFSVSIRRWNALPRCRRLNARGHFRHPATDAFDAIRFDAGAIVIGACDLRLPVRRIIAAPRRRLALLGGQSACAIAAPVQVEHG